MSDWDTRSSGAVFSDRLESETARSAYILVDGLDDHVVFDPTVRPIGAGGSIRINVLNSDGANSGNLDIPFGTTYDEGSTFYVSWRVKAPASFVYQPWPISGGADSGGKLGIISHNTGSNQPFEVVAQLTHMRNTFQGYHQDGSAFPPFDESIATACNSSDFKQQPEIDNGANPLSGTDPDTGNAWSSCQQARARYGSLYSGQSQSDYYDGLGDPLDGGMRFEPDVWYTITWKIVVGNWDTANSSCRLQVARGSDGYVTLIDATGVTLGDGGLPFNALHLLPYVTNRTSGGRKITTQPTNISGVTLHACGLSTPVGDGTLEYNSTTRRFRWLGSGESYGTARGFSEENGKMLLNVGASSGDSYVILEVTDPDLLPSSPETVTDTITIADGRPDTYINFSDVIVSTSDIPAPQPSALEALANSLGAGEWGEMSPANQDAVLGVGPTSGSTIGYCSTMPWNAITHVIEIVGMDHNAGALRHMRYDEAENSFVLVDGDALGTGTEHGYDHNAVNPYTGDLYFRRVAIGTGEITAYRKVLDGSEFEEIPTTAPVGFDQIAIGACWWSGAFNASGGHGSQGSFMVFNSGDSDGSATDGVIVAYDPVASPPGWFYNEDSRAPSYGGGSTYHSIMEYSTIKNVAVYGGGNQASNRLWKMDENGNVTALTNLPTGKTVGVNTNDGILVPDPVTGNFILNSADELWELDPDGSGTWTEIVGSEPPTNMSPFEPNFIVAVEIPDYGVIAYIRQQGSSGGSEMWLYKHDEALVQGSPSGGGGTTLRPWAGTHANQPGVI